MKVTKQEHREARELFRTCQVNGLLDDARVRNAVQIVLADKPRGYLQILSQFVRFVKLDQERRTARVESAIPLTSAEQNQVQDNLGRKYGPGLNISFAQNAQLIGGLRITVGSDVFDGSVLGRLERLRDSF